MNTVDAIFNDPLMLVGAFLILVFVVYVAIAMVRALA